MVKLIRKTYLEAKKPDKQTAPTTKQIKSKIQSIMDTECDSLSDLLDEKIKDKITLSSGVKLENLYTTMDDADTLETMIKGEKENSPMSPAYTISHLSELEPVGDGVCVKYKGSEVINPRLFYLLNKQFNAINKKSKDFHVSLSFNKPTHTQAYSLYYESAEYPAILKVEYPSMSPKEFIIKDSFTDVIEELSTPSRTIENMKKKIKEVESFLDLFGKENTALVDKRKMELDQLRRELTIAEYNNTVAEAITKTLKVIKQYPTSSTGKLKDGIDSYRNEETAILAINKDNLPHNDSLQAHIIVSLHVQRKGKGYVITCFGNPLDTAANIHIDSKGHLAL